MIRATPHSLVAPIILTDLKLIAVITATLTRVTAGGIIARGITIDRPLFDAIYRTLSTEADEPVLAAITHTILVEVSLLWVSDEATVVL